MNSSIVRQGTPATPTLITGSLQGSNAYDVLYLRDSKNTGAELSGLGLRNITIDLNLDNTLSATATVTHNGLLSINGGSTLAMGGFALVNPTLLTLGQGVLTTQHTGPSPIPDGRYFSFQVSYSNPTGGQKIVHGTYNGLSVLNTSGSTTLSDGGEITVLSGDFIASGTFVSTGSTVRFSSPDAQSVPAIAFNNLILAGSENKFFAGSSSSSGTLTIISPAIARLGSANHTAALLNFDIQSQPSGTFGSTASAAAFKIPNQFGTVDSGILTVSSSNCTPGLWFGYADNDWNNPANWCDGVPNSITDVTISAMALNMPIIGSEGAEVRNLTIETGASLAFLGATTQILETLLLEVYGNWTNNGIFLPGEGVVHFKGVGPQTFNGTETTNIYHLSLTKASTESLTLFSNLIVTDTLRLTSGTLISGTSLTMGTNSTLIRAGNSGATTTLTGSIQGSGSYDLIYQGNSKSTGAETTGAGLRNITLNLDPSQEITATANITHSGELNIPAGLSFDLSIYSLENASLTTSGTGLLKTASTSTPSLPRGRTWSFEVNYTAPTGDQSIVHGIYNTLRVLNTSGTNIIAPVATGGDIEIASGDFTKAAGGTISALNSRVVFSESGPQSIPGIEFDELVLQGSGEKTFTGQTSIVTAFIMDGTAVARLGNGFTHTAGNFLLLNQWQPASSFGSTASSATYQLALFFGTTDTGILNVANSICQEGIWLGYISSDWHNPNNWCGGVPDIDTDVYIPFGTPFEPVISSNSAIANKIEIQFRASLTIDGAHTLTVHGDWVNLGTFTPGTTSIVDFTGTSNAAISVGSFANISFTGTGIKTIYSTLSASGNITPISTAVVLSGANSLTLNPDKVMEITSTGSVTTVSGKLILEPGSIYVNRSSSNPTLEVRQTFTGAKGWRMMGTPIASSYSTLLSTFETQGFPGSRNPTLQPNLLWWDETDKGTTLQGWRQPASLSDAVPAGRGHYFYIFNGESKPGGGNYTDVLPKTITVTGSEVNLASGIFDFAVTFTARDTNLVAQADTLIEVNQSDEGFNLLANPTASTLDFHTASGWTKTNIDESIYIWDPASGGFLIWNGTTGNLGSGRIAPYQAFWIKANDAGPTLTLTGNGAKSLVITDFFGRKLENLPPILELNVAGEGLEARSYISFEPDGKLGEDPKDAYQLESLAENWLLLYTYGSLKTQSPLVINNQPDLGQEEKVIPLHLAASKGGQAIAGNYLMDWKIPAEWPTEVSVVLMDHISQKAIDMKKETMHSFSFQGPEIPAAGARKSIGEFTTPKAVIFRSPYESGEVNARTIASEKPQRPFTIYIGSFPDDRVEYLPDFPKLFAPVPNPFSQQTKIRFYLPVAENASVHIYNLIGQEVGSFPAQEYEAGIQELDWIPSAIDLQSGMYIIRLITSSGQFTQKLIKN